MKIILGGYFRMNLFILPASSKASQDHLEQTIEQTFDYKNYLEKFESDLQERLIKMEKNEEYVNLWGSTPGRKDTWKKMNPDDRVIFYKSKEFVYYGTIIDTHHDSEIANAVWNSKYNKHDEVFEYLILLKDVRKIKISLSDFINNFEYDENFRAQRLQSVLNLEKNEILRATGFSTLDELIGSLDNISSVPGDDNDEQDGYQDGVNTDENLDDVKKENKGGRGRRNKVTRKGATAWPRDPKIGADAIRQAEYKCELDESHKSFLHAKGNHQYMEAHHLIPMRAQEALSNDLDTQSNIVSLCPNCHRAIHHANKELRHNLVGILYEKRVEKLKGVGIEWQIDKILGYY